ncbi:MAG: extracellular solute-binding protein [Bacteriovoracia bacterium]
MMVARFAFLLIVLGLFSHSASYGAEKKKLWVYTSVYKEYSTPLGKAFEAKHPEYQAEIFQGGSEKLQAKVEAEILGGKPQADVVMTSDPFWTRDFEKRGQTAGNPQLNYYSLMVMVCHQGLPADKRPQTFQDLAKPEFKNLIQIGSPLESGTQFMAVAYLSDKYGWDFYEKLRANNLASSGGNSTVIQKVESGEKKVGIVLLENAIAARKRGSPIEIIYPTDGSIPLPNMQVMVKGSPNPEGAKMFMDFVLSKEGQQILLGGYMYTLHKQLPNPEGAKPLKEVTKNSTPWTTARIEKFAGAGKEIKKKFSQLILE